MSFDSLVAIKLLQAMVDIGASGWLNTPVFSPAKACGGIAQLVERLNGIQEVRSSTLLTSTTSESHKDRVNIDVYAVFCCLRQTVSHDHGRPAGADLTDVQVAQP